AAEGRGGAVIPVLVPIRVEHVAAAGGALRRFPAGLPVLLQARPVAATEGALFLRRPGAVRAAAEQRGAVAASVGGDAQGRAGAVDAGGPLVGGVRRADVATTAAVAGVVQGRDAADALPVVAAQLVGAAGCTAPARAEPLGAGVGPIGVAGVAPVAAVLEIVRETQEVAGSPLPLRRALAHARGAELSHGGETGGRRAPITGVGRVAVAVAPRAPRAPGVAPRAPGVAPRAPGVAPPRAAARRIVGCGSAAGASGGSLQLLELPPRDARRMSMRRQRTLGVGAAPEPSRARRDFVEFLGRAARGAARGRAGQHGAARGPARTATYGWLVSWGASRKGPSPREGPLVLEASGGSDSAGLLSAPSRCLRRPRRRCPEEVSSKCSRMSKRGASSWIRNVPRFRTSPRRTRARSSLSTPGWRS